MDNTIVDLIKTLSTEDKKSHCIGGSRGVPGTHAPRGTKNL